MKVLFLDIDGVLNSRAWAEKRGPDGFRFFDPEAVAQLKRIVEATGCRIVVSSSWRILRTFTELRAEFRTCGMPEEIVALCFDRTPNLPGDRIRGDEIAAWLKDFRRPVEAFVILDDNNDMGPLTDRLVQTEWTVGLTAADAERAIAALGAAVPA